jgi:uncharacterized protein (DUF58 family)
MAHVSRFLDPALIERLNQLQVSARSVVEGNVLGQHRSPVRGASIEFRQHRFYAAGDEPRRLDWRVFARTDRPYIKEYDEETNLRCVLLLDASGSMRYGAKTGTKFDYAAKLAAALGYLMLGQTESVGLAVLNESEQHWLPPHAGTQQLSRIVDVLERATPQGASDIGASMRAIADRLERRALVIVLSDLFTPSKSIRQGLARLRHDRHEVIAMRILNRNELEFPFRRFARFRGMEGETSILTETTLARQVYQQNFRRHEHELKDAFHSLGSELATFTTEKPLVDALTTFLRRRSGGVTR